MTKELPEFKDKIHEQKMNVRHFVRLLNDYHNLNYEVIRIEDGLKTP